ncbi:MAG: hypothetical protein KDD58_00685 [Bdellovibrionales bacterium]|nr:hypothetical protein [Bdellovibrionales bacterium]
MKLLLYTLILWFSFLQTAFADRASEQVHTQMAIEKVKKIAELKTQPWSNYYVYIPEKMEYNFELGSMWEANNLYWLGGSMGFHIGRCMFSKSQSCQQYADFIGGAGGRSGYTNGVLFSSVRWQFTDLSQRFVPHMRVILGTINHRDEERDRTVFAYGMGYGVTTSVHKRLDLKFEFRGGYGDKWWSQSFIGFSLKFDKFVDYFAEKLEKMGMAGRLVKGTAELTGKVIKGTVETTGKVIQKTMETTKDVIDEGGNLLNDDSKKASGEKDSPQDSKSEELKP